jgi:IS30 family transposase
MVVKRNRSIADVASHYGVSHSTVRRALDRVDEAKRNQPTSADNPIVLSTNTGFNESHRIARRKIKDLLEEALQLNYTYINQVREDNYKLEEIRARTLDTVLCSAIKVCE